MGGSLRVGGVPSTTRKSRVIYIDSASAISMERHYGVNLCKVHGKIVSSHSRNITTIGHSADRDRWTSLYVAVDLRQSSFHTWSNSYKNRTVFSAGGMQLLLLRIVDTPDEGLPTIAGIHD